MRKQVLALAVYLALAAAAAGLSVPRPGGLVEAVCSDPYMIFVFQGSVTVNKTFIHSVHRIPIYDIYTWNSTSWNLVEHWTSEFGAGEPDSPLIDLGGGTVEYIPSKGAFRFYGFQRPVGDELRFNVQAYVWIQVTVQDDNGHTAVLGTDNCDGTITVGPYSG